MRSSLTRGVIAKALLTVATAALLAGCSNSIERFQQAYKNPSDADPVYTASVPKPKKIAKPSYKKPAYEEPSFEASNDEIIEETPIKRAAIPMAKPKDYASAYSQPKLTKKKPKLVVEPSDSVDTAENTDGDYVAPVAVKAPFKKGPSAKPRIVEAPEEEVAAVEPVAPKKKIKFNAPKPVAVEEEVAEAVEEPVITKKAVKSAAGGMHTVTSGETLYSLGRKYGVSPFAIAEANELDRDKQLALGQQIRIPGSKGVKPAVKEETVAAADEDVVAPIKKPKAKAPLSLTEEEEQTADTDGETAIGEAPKKVTAEVKPKVKEPEMAAAPASPTGLNLRWPLKGKIISGFGNKPGGLKNEGINIAVPEGTSVRAADAGVVAYAGNELKGYGNLILIRHPGGYVTAYAHAKEIFVKRGDKVDRGAVIAKAGATGSVSSPQLHFEVRKGATALDPTKYLGSATAAN
jgi:murein DD-endopeptidase MepM/ murein hydrolase activator NlpD